MTLSAVLGLTLAAALLVRLALAVMHWPYQTVASPSPQTSTTNQNAQAVDLAAVQSLKLFAASKGAQAGTAQTKVATTDLDLSLDGVVLASQAKDSRALIVSNGQQRSYKSGDTLPVGAAVSLALIAQDHVLIRNNGIEQALWLYDAEHHPKPAKAATNTNGRAAESVAGNVSTPAAPIIQAAPQQIRKVSARLAEIMEVEPAASNGRLLGYRLSPGLRLKDFVQLGFKTNDIVTTINGIALNDKANLPQLYNLMNKPGDVSFSLLRDGQPLALQMTLAP